MLALDSPSSCLSPRAGVTGALRLAQQRDFGDLDQGSQHLASVKLGLCLWGPYYLALTLEPPSSPTKPKRQIQRLLLRAGDFCPVSHDATPTQTLAVATNLYPGLGSKTDFSATPKSLPNQALGCCSPRGLCWAHHRWCS